jgi:predicted MPP superfamily phosphohydrolase
VALERDDEERPRAGSIGVVLGGEPLGSGYHAWDDLEVRAADGTLLLREDFEDAPRFDAEWLNPAGPPDGFDATVMLLHSPAELLGRGRQPFLDLVLAGHTHGGQARLPPFGPAGLDPRIPAGWSSGLTRTYRQKRWLYVTRGIGTSGVPLRLNCPPELTHLTLQVVPRPARD